MKKLFLLFAAGSVALSAVAQERRANSVLFVNNKETKQSASIAKGNSPAALPATSKPRSAAKTTAGGGDRWYSYADFTANYVAGYSASYTAPYLWNDTTSKDAYGTASGGTEYDFNTLTSIGIVFDPFIAAWNDPATYNGMIQISGSDSYTIDSVAINGLYMRNNSDLTTVDTLIFALVYGNGASTSNLPASGWNDAGSHANFPYTYYTVDTLTYLSLQHDSIDNIAALNSGAAATAITKVPLHSTDTSGNYFPSISIPAFTVPAGNAVGMSVTFKSGTTIPFGDTVFIDGGTYKYGMFRPAIQYNGSSTSAQFPTYVDGDYNTGFFKEEGSPSWGGAYLPMWTFYNAAAGGGSEYQIPVIEFHVACSTCGLIVPESVATVKNITSVSAYPNPATDEVTVAFNLATRSNVEITLTNVLGQVISAQRIANVANGKAAINTSSLPAGVYIYTLTANGERSTGRVTVAH